MTLYSSKIAIYLLAPGLWRWSWNTLFHYFSLFLKKKNSPATSTRTGSSQGPLQKQVQGSDHQVSRTKPGTFTGTDLSQQPLPKQA